MCAVRDYSRKNGFSDALLGLSGGADSALVAAIAVEALGKEHVHAVMMPTRYTSDCLLYTSQAQMIAQLQKLAGLESDKKVEEKDSEAK